MVAEIDRNAMTLSELATSFTDSMVPTRTSIWSRSSGGIAGFTFAGTMRQFYLAELERQ